MSSFYSPQGHWWSVNCSRLGLSGSQQSPKSLVSNFLKKKNDSLHDSKKSWEKISKTKYFSFKETDHICSWQYTTHSPRGKRSNLQSNVHSKVLLICNQSNSWERSNGWTKLLNLFDGHVPDDTRMKKTCSICTLVACPPPPPKQAFTLGRKQKWVHRFKPCSGLWAPLLAPPAPGQVPALV